MNKSRKALIYIYPKRFTFVAKDIKALSEVYTVREHRFDRGGKGMLPWSFFAQFIWLLRAKASGADQALIHFAGYHALLPVLLGFRTHIIIAGSDACSFPAIDYGNFRKPFLTRCIGYAMRHAHSILPVHASLSAFQNTYCDLGPVEQGFMRFVAHINTPVRSVPYGFDADHWQASDVPEKERKGVICVAAGAGYGDPVYFRKGLDLMLEAAKTMPNVRFTIVGAQDPGKYPASSNVQVLGRVEQPELKGLLGCASIYCQASVMEGFPNALCEAMLMGAIPVVSNVTSMPDIVQDMGSVLEHRDPVEMVAKLIARLNTPENEMEIMRKKVRARILNEYPISLRVQKLEASLQER